MTRKDGCLVLGGEIWTGHQNHYIYLTADGGKIWTETGNVSKTYNYIISGAGLRIIRLDLFASVTCRILILLFTVLRTAEKHGKSVTFPYPNLINSHKIAL